MTIDRAYRHSLIGKIKGLADESKHLRLTIKKTNKKTHEAKVWGLTYAKRQVGYEARHLLLAYAAIRGVPYRSLEPKCRQENKPSPVLLLELIKNHSPYQLIKVEEKPGVFRWDPKWTAESVQAWLEEPIPEPKIVPSNPEPQGLLSRMMGRLGL